MHVSSTLKDEHHQISLFMKISLEDFKITEIEGKMDEKPFADCLQSLKIFEKIKGIEIGVGAKREYKNRFEKSEGCTHITELIFTSFDYVLAKLLRKKNRRSSPSESNKQKRQAAEFLCHNESCVVFNTKNLPCFDKKSGDYKGKTYTY